MLRYFAKHFFGVNETNSVLLSCPPARNRPRLLEGFMYPKTIDILSELIGFNYLGLNDNIVICYAISYLRISCTLFL